MKREIAVGVISLQLNNMLKSNFEFEIIVNGSSAKEYYHNGSHYIEGKEGSKFSLRMRNNSGARVLFVPTIDGLSVMSGDEASFESRGYIVKAYDSVTIDGWRTSNSNVAQFFFSNPKGSYAKKIKKGNNLGVIGCAVFKEKVQQPEVQLKWVSSGSWGVGGGGKLSGGANYFSDASMPIMPTGNVTANATNSLFACSTASAAPIQSLGTGFGNDKYSPTHVVSFDKETSPETIFSIYYNTRKGLEDMGVEFRKPIYVTPSAFPNEEGYCKRPKN